MSLVANEIMALVDADAWCELPFAVREKAFGDVIAAESSLSLADLRVAHGLSVEMRRQTHNPDGTARI